MWLTPRYALFCKEKITIDSFVGSSVSRERLMSNLLCIAYMMVSVKFGCVITEYEKVVFDPKHQ